MTTELLRLRPPGVGDEESAVICDELLLELHRRVGVVVLGEVGDDGLGNRLADGVHLGSVSTTLDTNTNVDAGERVFARYEDGFVDLEAEHLGLEEVDRRAIDTDESTAGGGVRDGGRGLQ